MDGFCTERAGAEMEKRDREATRVLHTERDSERVRVRLQRERVRECAYRERESVCAYVSGKQSVRVCAEERRTTKESETEHARDYV